MSREDQRAIGLQTAAQVYQTMPVLPDSSPETQYIRQLGQKLVATIPSQYSWPFEFHVVAQKEINAFALPGGPMFINVGAITAAADEAELAGVMAHEMSHVYMQHSAKQAHKAQTTGLLAGLAGAALGGVVGGTVGQLGQMGIQMTAQGMSLKFSRGDESQADAVGAMILYRAGYNPQALADFFKTLETQTAGNPPQWLSDHPNPGNRTLAIEKEIKDWPPQNYTTNSAAFQKTRQHALGVKSYSAQEIAQGAKSGQWSALNKKNGATFSATGNPAGNAAASAVNTNAASGSSGPAPSSTKEVPLQSVLPSERLTNADLGPLKIGYPDNWKVAMPKKQGQFVTIAPQAGVASNGVGYGVLLNGVAPPNGQSLNIDTLTRQLIQELQQNSGLQPVGDPQPIAVGGAQGRSAMLQSTSPFLAANGQAQKERDWLVTVPRSDGYVILMIFIAPESQFAKFQPTYQAMLKSLQL